MTKKINWERASKQILVISSGSEPVFEQMRNGLSPLGPTERERFKSVTTNTVPVALQEKRAAQRRYQSLLPSWKARSKLSNDQVERIRLELNDLALKLGIKRRFGKVQNIKK